jgi:hypothetical protein
VVSNGGNGANGANGGNAAPTPTPTPIKPASTTKAKVTSTRLMGKGSHRHVQVFVRSAKTSERIRVRLYSASGTKLSEVSRRVATNRYVKLAGVRVDAKAKSVSAAVLR